MKRWAIILTAFAFTGCVHFRPQPLDAVKRADEFESRRLDDGELRAFLEKHLGRELINWPGQRWDLELFTLAAFYYQPSLDVARAQWAVATAGKATAAERPNPTLSVVPGYNSTTKIPSPWFVTPSLDIPIETAGKRGYRIAQAQQLSEVARLNIAAVAWQVRSAVRRSLVNLDAALATEALLKEQQAIQTENLRLLELQYQAGAISAFELTQARVAATETPARAPTVGVGPLSRRRNASAREGASACGVAPVIISYNTTPSDQRSARRSTFGSPVSCSGAM